MISCILKNDSSQVFPYCILVSWPWKYFLYTGIWSCFIEDFDLDVRVYCRATNCNSTDQCVLENAGSKLLWYMVTQAVNCFRKKLCRLEKVDDKTDFHGVISIRNEKKLVLKYIFLISEIWILNLRIYITF